MGAWVGRRAWYAQGFARGDLALKYHGTRANAVPAGLTLRCHGSDTRCGGYPTLRCTRARNGVSARACCPAAALY